MAENENKEIPSLIKSLFLRQIPTETLIPYPSLNEEEQEFCDMMITTQEKFVQEKIDPEKIPEIEKCPTDAIGRLRKKNDG